MTKEEIIQKLHTAMTDARGQESHFESWMTLNEGICDAIDALKALDKQEPVAWMNDNTPSGIFARHIDGARNFGCTIPLYTTPPQRKPLTDEEILEVWKENEKVYPMDRSRLLDRTRACIRKAQEKLTK